jgi:hypothetical protein
MWVLHRDANVSVEPLVLSQSPYAFPVFQLSFGFPYFVYTYSGSHSAICGKAITSASARIMTSTNGVIDR